MISVNKANTNAVDTENGKHVEEDHEEWFTRIEDNLINENRTVNDIERMLTSNNINLWNDECLMCNCMSMII